VRERGENQLGALKTGSQKAGFDYKRERERIRERERDERERERWAKTE